MALIDERTIRVAAGRGGDGVVRFRHEKFREFGGPSGGDGGVGGDVYVIAVRDIMQLRAYQEGELFKAERGEDGRNNSQAGAGGASIDIKVPVGTVVEKVETGEVFELMYEGERVCVAGGGRGGHGNEQFKSSTDQAPKYAVPGMEGETATVKLTLKLIADAGFVGLPNAGKSSLLNALTNASAKVGNYPFTTLDPNLGAFYGYILADIPGIIEGASEGRGLGTKFLKHITRTRALIHCVSCEEEDVCAVYDVIRAELGQYDTKLLSIPELIVLTKNDVVDEAAYAQLRSRLAEHTGQAIEVVSIIDDVALSAFSARLSVFLAQHTPSATMGAEARAPGESD
jgi:GTPase